jgi:hypothetical protein
MERFHDVIHQTHEVVCGGRMHVLCHEVIDGPRSIAQTKQKHYQGILGKVP